MLQKHWTCRGLIYAAICAATLVGSVALDRAEAADPVDALPERFLSSPPRQALPPRDCLRCDGPCAPSPCLDTHRGYLYYGTFPWDDDPVNEFNDCPGGRCGYPGAMLSLYWIRAHQREPVTHARPAHHARRAHQARGRAACRPLQAPAIDAVYASDAVPASNFDRRGEY